MGDFLQKSEKRHAIDKQLKICQFNVEEIFGLTTYDNL